MKLEAKEAKKRERKQKKKKRKEEAEKKQKSEGRENREGKTVHILKEEEVARKAEERLQKTQRQRKQIDYSYEDSLNSNRALRPQTLMNKMCCDC